MDKARGIVIRLTKLTETSLIVHWCTREAGLLKTVAKGARRPKSAFAGKLDLFLEADLVWVPSRRSELHILKEVEVREFHLALRRSYPDTVLAAYFGQLLEQVLEREHPEPEVYELLRGGLEFLAREGSSRNALLHYERRLAEVLGVGHEAMNAGAALERAFGSLPKGRADCLAILTNGG